MAISKKTVSEKEFYNLGELKSLFEQKYSEYITEKKYREKLSEIFKVIAIQPKCLQGGKNKGVYMIPASSVDFMYDLYKFSITPEGQELRRGNLDKVSIERLEWIIKGVYEMLKASHLSEDMVDEQIQLIAQRLDIMDIKIKAEIKSLLEGIRLDFFPEDDEDIFVRDETGNMHYNRDCRFRYRKEMLRKKDMYLFYQMVRDDLMELQDKHRKIYGYMNDIRSEEISDSSVHILDQLSGEESERLTKSIMQQCQLIEMLGNCEKYRELMAARDKLFKTNDFMVDKQRQYYKLQREIDEIEQEYIDKHFGGSILDADALINDSSKEKSPDEVLQEAIDYYAENDSIESFAERLRIGFQSRNSHTTSE